VIVDRNYPILLIQICGLPSVIDEDGYYDVDLRVENCSRNPVNEYQVMFDLPGLLMHTGTGKLVPLGKIRVVVISEPLNVNQTTKLPIVVGTLKMAKLRFFLDGPGHRMRSAKCDLNSNHAVEVST
jgi:hypothetical protein